MERFAYTAVINDGYTIGKATEGIPGYTIPNPRRFDSYDHAARMADDLNAELGLDKKTAWRIVASTMDMTEVAP